MTNRIWRSGRLTLLASALAASLLACSPGGAGSSGDGGNGGPTTGASQATAAPQSFPTPIGGNCGDMIYNALVAEHEQPMRSIIISLPPSATGQTVSFIAPDRFLWHVETPAGWEEAVSIGGVVSSRSSVQDWTTVDVLSPLAAAAMVQFTDPPPAQGTAEGLIQLLEQLGVANPSLEANLTGPVTGDGSPPTWLCEILYKSNGTVIGADRTWIGVEDGLRHNFEHEDNGVITEMRTFLYEGFAIEGP